MSELEDGLRKLWAGDLDGAAALLDRALAAGARPAATPLGEALLALGRPAEAAAAFAKGEGARAQAGEGQALLALGRPAEAAAKLREAATASPDADTLIALAEAEDAARDLPAAVAAAERALRLSPGDPTAQRLVDRLRGERAPFASLASPDRARASLDQNGQRFDEDLAKLGYHGPRLLYEAVRAAAPEATALDVLDLGCGAGLAGAAFRALARRLVGCDVASRMLAEARRRGVYDRLEEGDLLEALGRAPAAWDLILVADVMIYFGDLSDVFQRAARALKPRGLFAFTVERGPDDGWALTPRGRFQHGAGYLRAEAERAGLAVAHLAPAPELRRERNAPVEGFAAVLRKD